MTFAANSFVNVMSMKPAPVVNWAYAAGGPSGPDPLVE
jgi:roadblock/LC7 domain-containing protein